MCVLQLYFFLSDWKLRAAVKKWWVWESLAQDEVYNLIQKADEEHYTALKRVGKTTT